MSSYRWIAAASVATVLLTAGCSSSSSKSPAGGSSSTVTSPSTSSTPVAAKTSSSTPTQIGTLDTSKCVTVTEGNLDLSVAGSKAEARTAADSLEKFGPPSDVKAAIEHFVSTDGAQFDDPDYSKDDDMIQKWVHQLCPA